MENFTNQVLDIFINIRIIDVIDILIVAYVIYQLLMLMRDTRAEQLIKGLGILLVISRVSEYMKLYVINYLLKNTFTLGFVALIIVFQPELRRALEYIGRSKLLTKSLSELMQESFDDNLNEIISAAVDMSRQKIGALIVMTRETGLGDIIENGTAIDGRVTSELLKNIFFPNSPLHDGAIIISDKRIMAAGCVLPLSQSQTMSKALGTRHRAALGMVEMSDAVVLVVSEETGGISIAKDGKLYRYLDRDSLKELLEESFSSNNDRALIKPLWGMKND